MEKIIISKKDLQQPNESFEDWRDNKPNPRPEPKKLDIEK